MFIELSFKRRVDPNSHYACARTETRTCAAAARADTYVSFQSRSLCMCAGSGSKQALRSPTGVAAGLSAYDVALLARDKRVQRGAARREGTRGFPIRRLAPSRRSAR